MTLAPFLILLFAFACAFGVLFAVLITEIHHYDD
jgi:hypothetical protein